MALALKGRAVVAKLGAAIARYFELALKVIYPAANKRRRVRRKILF